MVTGGLHPSGREQVMPVLLSLLEHLTAEHDVHAFAVRHLPEAASYRLAGAQVHDLGRPERRFKQWTALADALRAHGPFDIIHGWWADPAGLLAAIAGRRLNVPSVVTCSSGEFTSLPDIGYGLQRSLRGRAAVLMACRLATTVHVTTEYMQALAERHGIRATRVPLGVDTTRLSSDSPPREGPPWRLLQVAAINPVKDQATLLRAVAQVRRTHDVTLDLVGEDTSDGRLEREAAALGLSDVVRLRGFLPQDALAPFHRAAHLYVQSSRHEAGGIAVLEAAAAGIPIVGTRVGFVSDWDGRAAVGVPVADAAALAGAIVDLLRNPERRRTLARAARAWSERHDARAGAQAMARLYSQAGEQVGR